MKAAALLVLMLMAQTLSFLHAEIHAFHDADELCVAFHNVEKQPTAVGSVGLGLGLRLHAAELVRVFPPPLGIATVTVFQARAPPQLRA